MLVVTWTLAALGLLSIVLCTASVVQPLKLSAIHSNQASAELIRRSDDAPRYWSLIQVRMAQSVIICALVVMIGWRYQL